MKAVLLTRWQYSNIAAHALRLRDESLRNRDPKAADLWWELYMNINNAPTMEYDKKGNGSITLNCSKNGGR